MLHTHTHTELLQYGTLIFKHVSFKTSINNSTESQCTCGKTVTKQDFPAEGMKKFIAQTYVAGVHAAHIALKGQNKKNYLTW